MDHPLALYTITTAANSLDPDELLSTLLDVTLALVNADAGWVLLSEPTRLASWRGVPDTFAAPGVAQALQACPMCARILRGDSPPPGPQPLAGYLDLPAPPAWHSCLGIPITAGHKVIGVLALAWCTPYPYSEVDHSLLTSIGQQVGIALENAYLFQSSRQRTVELQALYETSLRLSSQLETPDLLHLIVEQAVSLLGAEAGDLYIYNPHNNELVVSVAVGYFTEFLGVRLKPGEGLAGWVFENQQALAVEDYNTWPGRASVYQGEQRFRAVLAVPLLGARGVLGVLDIGGGQDQPAFGEHDVWLAGLFAAQAAVALENAHLHAQVQRRAREMAALNTAGQAMVSTLDLHVALDVVIAEVRSLLEAEAASVLLYDPSSREMVFAASAGPGARELVGTRLPVTAGIVGWVMQAGQATLVTDARSDARFYQPIDDKTGLTTRSLLAVPLIFQGKTSGVIEAINKLAGGQASSFTEHDLDMLKVMANSAAIAIANARLFEAEQRQREMAETLREVGAVLTSSLDVDTVLDRLLEQVERVVPNDASNVMLIEDDCVYIARWRGYERFGAQEHVATLRFPISSTPNLRSMFESGQAIVVPDTAKAAGWIHKLETTWLRSYAGAPIRVRGQIIGFLNVDSATPGFFGPAQTEQLQAFANQAALAIQNARLFGETRRRLEELAVISEVALAGAAKRPFDEAVTRATDSLGRLWPDADLGFLFVDEVEFLLRMHPSYKGVPPDAELSLPLDQGITGLAVQERRAIQVGDVTSDPHYVSFVPGICSEMAAPLVIGDRVIGVVNVESPHPNAFSEADLRLLTTLAGQLATLFEKARLDAALAEYAAELERRVEERTAEIRSQQARTQAILDALGEGVVVTDLEGTVLYLNPASETLTGYTANQALGQTPRLWQSGLTPPELYKDMWDTILAGGTWQGEIANRRKDGTLYDATLTIAPILADGSRPAGFVGVQHDITRLKELDRLKSEFVSNVSHELRTPLSNIKLYLGLLKGGRPEQFAQYVEVLTREELRLEHLIEDLLTLSRMDLARVDMQRAWLDMDALVRQLVADRQALAAARGLALSYEAPPEPLPLVLGDEAMISQVLTNLVSNAMNYTPRGGTIVLRSLCSPLMPGWVGVCVQDTGLGITPQDRERLFERFYRGQAARQTGAPGTGLGLAICKGILDQHKGRISVESTPGVGSTFSVWLPGGEA